MTAILLTAFYVIMAGSLTYAWIFGAKPERAAVLLLLGFLVFRIVLRPLVPAEFNSIDPLAFAQDFVGFAGFVWIGLRAGRYWPLVAAALQLLSLSAHIARALSVPIDPWAYALTKSGPTLLVYLTLVVGTASYRHRARRATRLASFPFSSGPTTAVSSQMPWPRWRSQATKGCSSRSTMTTAGSSKPAIASAEDNGSTSNTET